MMTIEDVRIHIPEEVRKLKQERNIDEKTIEYLTSNVKDKTPEGEVLDKLNNIDSDNKCFLAPK